MSYSDFPILQQHTYLDSASTTHKPDYVVDKTSDFIRTSYANIGRGQYPLAWTAEDIYDQSKRQVASYINATEQEIVYTYSSTYAYNLLAYTLVENGRIGEGDSVILSVSEHHANILVRQKLAKQYRFTIEFVQLTQGGHLDYNMLATLMNASVKVVSLTGASNVTGKITDIAKVRSIIGDTVFLAIDGSQLVPNRYVDVKTLGIDALIWTGHKMMGYTGLGILYLGYSHVSTLTNPWLGGGIVSTVGTQHYELMTGYESWEAGTPNIIGAVSYLHALEYFASLGGYKRRHKQDRQLIAHIKYRFAQQTYLTPIFALDDDQLSVVSFYRSDGGSMTQFGEYLGQQGICIRTGGHCAHPLIEYIGHGQLGRLSCYIYTTIEDIDRFFDVSVGFLSQI